MRTAFLCFALAIVVFDGNPENVENSSSVAMVLRIRNYVPVNVADKRKTSKLTEKLAIRYNRYSRTNKLLKNLYVRHTFFETYLM